MALRPDIKEKFLGGEGHFKLKHQAGNLQMFERMNDRKFSVLQPDASIADISIVKH